MNHLTFLLRKLCLLVCILVPHTLTAQEPINLIWLGLHPQAIWEGDWIHELLQDISIPVQEFIDGDRQIFLDRSILVCSSCPPHEYYLQYFKECDARGLKYGIIYLSDENYSCGIDQHPNLRFVIRNYWHRQFTNKLNVLCIPLGYKNEFWKGFTGTIKKSQDRKYSWSFAGQMKSTRNAMINQLKKIPQGYIHEISGWAASDSLSAQDYRNMLLDSVFCPCPRGWWNLDSFRVSEALEAGCIPIVEKIPFDEQKRTFDYFQLFYGNHPFLSVSSWNEAPGMMRWLLNHPEELEQRRRECYEWWQAYKLKTRKEIAHLIETNLE